MLCISRRVGEGILIGENVSVDVCRYRYDQGRIAAVILGFEAPESVRILRKEVADRIAQNGENGQTKAKVLSSLLDRLLADRSLVLLEPDTIDAVYAAKSFIRK